MFNDLLEMVADITVSKMTEEFLFEKVEKAIAERRANPNDIQAKFSLGALGALLQAKFKPSSKAEAEAMAESQEARMANMFGKKPKEEETKSSPTSPIKTEE
jgi:hypothetical protein